MKLTMDRGENGGRDQVRQGQQGNQRVLIEAGQRQDQICDVKNYSRVSGVKNRLGGRG